MPCLAECLMVQWIRSGEEEWLEGKGRETLPMLGRPLWQVGGGVAGACLKGGQQRSLEPAQCASLRRLSTAANRSSLVLVIFNSETWSILLSSIIPVLCSIWQQSSRWALR